mmetsp:Transcript_95429/g.179507  ORF Transcript_95429/g.179507 Transcript_95429/m.179507 type:complete len:618 (+) Transcript_95429:75-1928(+)
MCHLSFALVSACLASVGQARRMKVLAESREPLQDKDVMSTHNAFAMLLLALKSAPAFNTPAAGGMLPLHATALACLQPSNPHTLQHFTPPKRRALTPRSGDLVEELKYQLSSADPETKGVDAIVRDPAGAGVLILLAAVVGFLGYIGNLDKKQTTRAKSGLESMERMPEILREQGNYEAAAILERDVVAQKEIGLSDVKEIEEKKEKVDKFWKKLKGEKEKEEDPEDAGNRFSRRQSSGAKKAKRERTREKKLRRRAGDIEMSISETPRPTSPLTAVSGLLSSFSAPSSFSVGENTNVEPLGFGTWQWGNKLLWGYDPAADEELQRAFDVVATPENPFDSRRFFFDTGDSYGTGKLEGRGEELLGRFRRESAKPERAVCGTKLAVYPWRLTGKSFEEACRNSLARMGRDQIELAQAHWSAKNLQPWQEPALWDGLARCHEQGLCRSVGTSNFGPEQLNKVNKYWRDRGVPHTVNQMQLSLLSTLPIDSGCLDACREMGVTPIGYSPLSLGVLSGKYSEERLPEGPRSLIFKALLPSLKPLLGTIGEIAKERNVPFSAVPINWAMGKGALVIVGMKTPEQVRENLQACGWRLNDDEVEELERTAKMAKKATQNIFQTD